MTIEELFKDKSKKAKEKTTVLAEWISEKSLPIDELLAYAEKAKDPEKGSCIEAMEYATKLEPSIVTEEAFDFVIGQLQSKAGRIQWESAKVIGIRRICFHQN